MTYHYEDDEYIRPVHQCAYTSGACLSQVPCDLCSVYKTYWDERRRECCFVWHIFDEDKPTEPIEYLVCIDGAKVSTTLIYDGQIESFVNVDGVPYNVKYWALLPEPPKEKEGDIS